MAHLPLTAPAGPAIGPILTPGRRAALALALATLFWAGNFIAGRALRGQVEPATLNLLRWLLCLALMLPWVGVRAWRCRGAIAREWRLLLALGATGIAAFHTMVYQALASTTAISALLMLSLALATILLGAALGGGPRPSQRQWVGTMLSLAGGAIVLTQGRPDLPARLQVSSGELWMAGAVLAWTLYCLLLRRRPADLPPDVTLAASTVPAIALLLPAVALTGPVGLPALTPTAWWAVLYIGVFASLLAFLLWSHGVALIGPERAGQFVHLMPVFGTLLAVVLLDEQVLAAHVAGGLCVVAGMALGQWKGKHAEHR